MSALTAGDRVRYDNGDPSHKWNAYTGTVSNVLGATCTVNFDNGLKGVNAKTRNLKRITDTMTKIDTTKNLQVVNAAGGISDVNFITETSEGHILVDPKPGQSCRMGWIMFDKNGKFVRSNDGQGSGLTLRNVAVEKVEYYFLDPSDGKFNGPYGYEPGGYGEGSKLKVTSVNGKITATQVL